MELLTKHIIAIFVFCAIQIEAGKSTSGEDKNAAAEDAKVFIEAIRNLQALDKNYDNLIATHMTTLRVFQDTVMNALNQATESRLAVDRSLLTIAAAAASIANISQACANTEVIRKADIVRSTNEQIKTALRALDQFKSIENELKEVKLRLKQNSVQSNIDRLLTCKENVNVTSANVANITKCYRQIEQTFVSYIQTESQIIREQNSAVVSASKTIDLVPVFDKIIMKAVNKAKSDVEDILFLCKRSNQTINVGKEIDNLENENQNKINSEINKIFHLLDLISLRALNFKVEVEAALSNKLVLPEMKAEILKNITAAVNVVLANNATENITSQLIATIDRLNANVTEDYVKTKCEQDVIEPTSYNICVEEVIAELKQLISNTDVSLDDLYNKTVKINESLNAAISVNLKASLDKVYDNTNNNVGAVISNLLQENQGKINSEMNKILNLADAVNSRVSNIEAYVEEALNNKLVLPEVKAEILKNVTAAARAVLADNVIENIKAQVFATIDNLEGNVTEDYVKKRCENLTEPESYNICVQGVIVELKEMIKNADKIFDDLFNQIINLNETLNSVISANLKESLDNVYNNTTNSVAAVIDNLTRDNQDRINSKIYKTLDLLDVINSRASNLESDVEAALSNKLVLPEVKAEILANVSAVVKAFLATNGTGNITEQLYAIIDHLNDNVSEEYVNSKCEQYTELESYNGCADDVIAEIKEVIKKADLKLDDLYDQAVKLNESLNFVISTKLKEATDNVYKITEATLEKAIDNLLKENQDKINSEINRVFDLIDKINSRIAYIEADVEAALDNKLVLPEVKAEILKNITSAAKDVLANNAIENIIIQVYAAIDDLNGNITVDNVKTKCQQYTEPEAYTGCVKRVVDEIKAVIKEADVKFNDLFNQTVKLNESVNAAISVNLKVALDNLYSNTTNTVESVINDLIKENQEKMKTETDKILDLLNVINSRASNLEPEVDAALDAYLEPLVSLLNSTLHLFPNYTDVFSLGKLVRPEVKADILRNVTAAVKVILADNATENIKNKLFATTDDLNDKVTKDYVKSKCEQFSEPESYNACVKGVIEELKETVKNAQKTLDDLYNQSVDLNESLNNAVSVNLQPPLNNVYNDAVHQAINLFTQALASGLNTVNVGLGNTYNNVDKKLDALNAFADNLINNTFNNIKAALDFALKFNLSINYQQIYPNLETLKKEIKKEMETIINAAMPAKWDKEKYLNASGPITIDTNQIETALKNCTAQADSIEQAVNNCIKAIIDVFKNDLKSQLETLNNSQENVLNFIVKVEKDINQLVQNYTVSAYEVVKNASKDPDSAAIVQILEKNVLSERGNIQDVLDKIKIKLDTVNQLTLDSIKDVQNKIDEALSSLTLALDVTATLNPQANLSQQKAVLEKLKIDAQSKTNASISVIINQFAGLIGDFTKQYQTLSNDYKTKIAELNETTINNRCKKQTIGEAGFIACVDNVIKEYNNNVNILNKNINDLYVVVKDVVDTINSGITSKVTDDLKAIEIISNTTSSQIYSTFNVTNKQLIYNALTNLKQYNISNIIGTVSMLLSLSNEIIDRDKTAKNAANYTLTTSGSAINDIVGIGRKYCSQRSVDQYVKESADLINAAKTATFAVAPDLSSISNSLFLLAKYINNTLNYQMQKLSEEKLYESCPKSLANDDHLQDFYKCILIQIYKFGRYYSAESDMLRFYENTAYEKSRNSWALLNQWNSQVVLPKFNEISKNGNQLAESFYFQCGIGGVLVFEYTLGVAKNHYNTFQPRITSNVTAINDLVTVIYNKNYTSYTPDITSQLQTAVAALNNAITAVLNSNKSAIITDEIKSAPGKIIADGVKAMNAYIANYPAQSLYAVQQAANLVQTREELHKNYTEEFLFNSCYRRHATYPMVDLNGCTNVLTYNNIYKAANVDILNKLLDIKQNLINMDTNYAQVFSNQANYLVKEQTNSVYYLAYKLYSAAGLKIPQEIGAAVDINRCYYGLTLPTSEFVCVIVV